MRDVPKQVWRWQVDPRTGAFGGAPYRAANRVRGVPKWGGGAMRTLPFGPSVELSMGREPCEGCAKMKRQCHADPPTGDLRWSSFWGREQCEGCATTGRRCHVDTPAGAFGGAPYGATILVRGVPNRERMCHANPATWAFGGAPYGATILVRGVPKWLGDRMRALLLKPSLELPMGPRSS